MIDQQTIDRAIGLLLEATPPGSRVILFGSYAKGEAGEDSDVDFLIVEPSPPRRREDMVRLRQVLRPLRVPVDVLVVSQAVFEAWKNLPNNVIAEAARGGKSFTHAA